MKPRSRKAFAAVALAAGASLVFFELRRAAGAGQVESWFWLAVGVMTILLAGTSLVAGRGGHDDEGKPGLR